MDVKKKIKQSLNIVNELRIEDGSLFLDFPEKINKMTSEILKDFSEVFKKIVDIFKRDNINEIYKLNLENFKKNLN